TDGDGIGNACQSGLVNHPPVANAGGPYTTDLGAAVSFDGTASTDPDSGTLGDHIVSYTWAINNAITLTGATPTLSGSQTASLGAGTFPVALTVSDSFGITNSAQTT